MIKFNPCHTNSTQKLFFMLKKGAVIIITAVLFLFTSCNPNRKKAISSFTNSSKIIDIPASSKLSIAEVLYYKNTCRTWYDSVLGNSGFNGGIIVAKNGQIVFETYQGTGHLGLTDSINTNTPFHIASVSKTFTAMAVLKLWQDGKIDIDEPFSNYFQTFNYPAVSIRSLLTHRSGLPNYVYFMETLGWDKSKLISNVDVYDYLVNRKKDIKNITTPNTHFNYCNTNYCLLALLIEKVSGMKYAAFLHNNFFTPLQMNNSFVFDSTRFNNVNPSYDWRGKILPFNFLDAVYGDKNIYSTAADLLKWDRAISSGKLFTVKTLEAAYTGYSNEKNGIRNYGLGWRMNIYPNGKKMIYHNGWWHGNNASFIRLIEDSATIIVVGNKFNRGVYHAKDLAALFGDFSNLRDEEESSVLDSNATVHVVSKSKPMLVLKSKTNRKQVKKRH